MTSTCLYNYLNLSIEFEKYDIIMFSFGSLKLRRKQLFQGCFIQRYTSQEEIQNYCVRIQILLYEFI